MLVTIPDMVVADGFVRRRAGSLTSRPIPPFMPIPTRSTAAAATRSPAIRRSRRPTRGDRRRHHRGGRHLHDGDINPDIIELDFSGFAIDAPAGLTETG
jgi:hypothetical protein